MPVAPATIVRTNRSCPGTSTTESRRPSGSSSGAYGSIRDPPALFLRQPVEVSLPVSARTSHVFPWSMCPAVPTVSGVTDPFALWPTPRRRRRPRRSRPRRECGSRGVCGRRGRPRSPAARPDGAARRGSLDCTGCARQLGERQRPAAHARDALLDVTADERHEPLRPSTNLLDRLVEHPEHRNPISGRRIEATESVPSSAASELVGAQQRWKRVAARRSTSSARPTTIPACGPPRSLSPRSERHPPRTEALARRRLVADRGERA